MSVCELISKTRSYLKEQGSTITMRVTDGLVLGDGIGKTIDEITEGHGVNGVSINRAFATIDIGEDELADDVESEEDVEEALRRFDANKEWTVHQNSSSGRISISMSLK